MTVIKKFVDFMCALPADSAQSVEAALTQIMESYSSKYDLTPDQSAELDSRMAKEHPEYAIEAEITKTFGKPFSA